MVGVEAKTPYLSRRIQRCFAECPVEDMFRILRGDAQNIMPRGTGDGQERETLGFHRLQPHLHLKRKNGVECPTGGAGESGFQSLRITHRLASADKPVPVRLVPFQRDVRVFGHQSMQKERWFSFGAPGTPLKKQSVVIGEVTATDEQLAEGRMPFVVHRGFQYDFAIGRNLDDCRCTPFVDQGYLAYFDIVERRDGQLLPGRDILVAAKGFRHMLVKYDLAVPALLICWQKAH